MPLTASWLSDAVRDVRYGSRALMRHRRFAVIATLTIGLAIGATGVAFVALKTVVLDPLPYGDPDRLATIAEAADTPQADTISAATARDLVERSRTLARVSLWVDAAFRPVQDGRAGYWRGIRVSSDYFDTLGVPMLLGRSFRSADDERGAGRVVILTYAAWMEHFGGDPAVIGRLMQTTDDGEYRVIGVLPSGFFPMHMSNPAEFPTIFKPLGYDALRSACRTCRGLRAVARLRAGVSTTTARAELRTVMNGIAREHPADYPHDAAIAVTPLSEAIVGRFGPVLWMVQAAVLLVLLLACINVGMMQLARTWSRDAELAVRSALGATRSQIVRQLLTESALLALPGGVLGALLAWWGARLIARAGAANIPRLAELRIEASTLGTILLVAVASALAFGMLSAIVASHTRADAIRRGGRVAGGESLSAVRVVGAIELTLAFVLVFVVGLLAKSYARVLGVDPGYDPNGVLTVSLLPDGANYGTQAQRLAYFDAVVDRVRAIPGVRDAGYASTLPLANAAARPVYVRERPISHDADASQLDVYLVSGRYLDVMRIPLLRGRGFTAGDVSTTAPVAVVSESTARRLFGGEDPIGGHLQIDRRDEHRPWATIVGVVGDIHQSALDQRADSAVYLLFSQTAPAQGFARLAIRGAVPIERIESAVGEAMVAVDPLQPVFHMQPLSTYVALSIAERPFMLALLGAFAALALLLALGGVYGLMSYQVERRTREVGIRFALGATPADVVRMIVTQVLTTAGAALVAGGIVAALVARALSVFLFGVTPLDAGTLMTVASLIVAVALAASALPMMRLARVDPVTAIRADG